MEARILRHDGIGCLVFGIGEHGGQRLAHLAAGEFGGALEEGACRVAKLDREFILPDLVDRRCQRIDRIVGTRDRAVAAGVGRFQKVVLDGLLTDLHRQRDLLARLVEPPAAAFVEREFCGDQLRLVGRKPFRAVKRTH